MITNTIRNIAIHNSIYINNYEYYAKESWSAT
jgi:hypothetical protein